MIVEAAVIEWKVGAFVPVTVKVEAASSTVESTEAETEEAKAESEKREEAETEAESTGAASGSSIDFFLSYEYCSWWSKGTSRVIALRASIGLCYVLRGSRRGR